MFYNIVFSLCIKEEYAYFRTEEKCDISMAFLIVYLLLGTGYILVGGISRFQVPKGLINRLRGSIAASFMWPVFVFFDQSAIPGQSYWAKFRSQSKKYHLVQDSSIASPLTIQTNSLMDACNQIHEYVYSKHGIQSFDWRLSLEVVLKKGNNSFPRIVEFGVMDSDNKEALYYLHILAC